MLNICLYVWESGFPTMAYFTNSNHVLSSLYAIWFKYAPNQTDGSKDKKSSILIIKTKMPQQITYNFNKSWAHYCVLRHLFVAVDVKSPKSIALINYDLYNHRYTYRLRSDWCDDCAWASSESQRDTGTPAMNGRFACVRESAGETHYNPIISVNQCAYGYMHTRMPALHVCELGRIPFPTGTPPSWLCRPKPRSLRTCST